MKILKAIYKFLCMLRWCIPVPYRSYLGRHNPRKLVQRVFRRRFGREIDFENPRTHNEIINTLKLTGDLKLWSRLADKHLVRDYIKERGLDDVLIEQYAVYDSAWKIDFDALPQSFILKPNNGAGSVIIVKDKSTLNKFKTRVKLWWWMHKDYGYKSGEFHYAMIKPKVICEKLLVLSEYDKTISQSIVDYKWFCFNGEVTYCEVITDRWQRPANYYIYDNQWNNCPHYVRLKRKTTPIPRPKALEKMIEVCAVLSKGIPQVRIDLYEVDGKVYFGEMTFTSGGGFSLKKTDAFDELMAQFYYANLP